MTDLDRLSAEIALLARPLLVALDVDGTLAPIVSDPATARVPMTTQACLARLATIDGVSVAIVTGRDADQLARMISVPDAWRIVEHGLRILAPGKRAKGAGEDVRRMLVRFRSWATEHASPRGAHIEEKTSSIVVHVRELAERDRDAAEDVLRAAHATAVRQGLFAREGRAVLEASVAHADKGAALASLMSRLGAASCMYAGDDRTDEPAIAVASARGIGLFVRSPERPEPPAGAKGVLEGPEDVARLLVSIVARLCPEAKPQRSAVSR